MSKGIRYTMGNGILLKLAVGVCCALAVFGLAACTPRGAANRTKTTRPSMCATHLP